MSVQTKIKSGAPDAGAGRRNVELGYLVFRVTFGAFFLYHGIWHFSKGMGWFTALMRFVDVPLPALTAHVVAIFELVSGAGLIVGLATRVWSALGIAMMFVTGLDIKIAQLHTGFLGPTGAGGAETDFLYLLCFLVLLCLGAGAYSIDSAIGLDARLGRLLPRRRADHV